MSDTDRDTREFLRFTREESVVETIEMPSALWALIDDATDADETVEEWLIRQASIGLRLTGDERPWTKVQADVEVDAETWETIRLRTLESLQHGADDPGLAFADVLHEYIQTHPNLVVDGEVKRLDDVAEWVGDD
jgi:hypothetical protein